MRLLCRNSLGITLEAVSEAQLLNEPVSRSAREETAAWIARRQGVDGSYADMFAPTPRDFRNAVTLVTGERLTEIELKPIVTDTPHRDVDPKECQAIIDRFVDWLLMGLNVLQRGEYARSLDTLWWVQRHLLMMARVVEASTEHWLTPSQRLEADLSASMYEKFSRCTSSIARDHLERAYCSAWNWAMEMLPRLAEEHQVSVNPMLLEGVESRMLNMRL